MARLTMDQPEFAEKPGGPRCILDGLGSELTEALFQISSACPAVAAETRTSKRELYEAALAARPD